MKKTLLFLSLTALIFTNCSKDDDGNVKPRSIVDEVAFLLYDDMTNSVSYYHNGEVVPLNSSNGDINVKGITIDGNTIYAAGSQKINDIWSIALWKNGILDANTPTYPERCYIEAMAIENGEVYLAGRRVYDGGDRIDGAYWRDNVYKALPKNSDKSFANDINVSNGLIAIAGSHSQPLSPSTATAWENDVLFEPNGPEFVQNIAYCVYNNGTNPIYGGYKTTSRFQPTVWDKNGVILTFALPEGKSGVINKIIEFQNDIYTLVVTNQLVNGNQLRTVELWKNGIFQETLIEALDDTVRALFLDEINNQLYYAASSNNTIVFKTFEKTIDLPMDLEGKTVFDIGK